MAPPMKTGMPFNCPLGHGYTIEFVALSPTDGSEVSGVEISKVLIYAETGGASAEDLSYGPFMFVPGPNA